MAQGNQLKRTFGQAYRSNKSSSSSRSRYQRQHGSSYDHSKRDRELTEEQEKAQRRLAQKLKRRKEDEDFDAKNGFERFCFANSFASTDKEGKATSSSKESGRMKERRGWIFNMLPTVSDSFD